MSRSKTQVILASLLCVAILIAISGCEQATPVKTTDASNRMSIGMTSSDVGLPTPTTEPQSVQISTALKGSIPELDQQTHQPNARRPVEPDPEIPVDWDSYKVLQEMRESWLPPSAREKNKLSSSPKPNG